LRLIQYVDFSSSGLSGEPTFDRLVRALHMPEAGHSPQGEEPIPGQSRRLWLYGAMGGLLVLGLLFAWLWHLLHLEIPGPPPLSVLQGHLQVNVNVDAARVSVDGIGIGVARRQAPLFLSNLKAGIARIRVEADGYEPQERRVNISVNEWTQAGFVLTKHLDPEKTRTTP
jgi:hypothetical protein